MKKLMRVFGSISNMAGENRRTSRSSTVSIDGEVDPGNPQIIIEDRGSRRSSAVPGNLATYTSYKRSSLDSLDQINNHLLRFPEKLVIDSFFSKVHKAAYDGDMTKLTKNAKKVSVSLPDSNGRTALHLAASRGHKEAVTYLLSVGAEIDAVDEFGSTALLEAIKGGHKDTVLLLLKKRASLTLRDSEGNSALHFTCLLPSTSSSNKILEAVIKRDSSAAGEDSLIETVNDIGRTPLHFACLRANMTACVKLLESGASVNCSDKEAVTALMLAAQSGNVQVIDCLLNYSANPFLKDARDYTAEDYAKLSGNDYVKEMLIKATNDGDHLEEDAEISGKTNSAQTDGTDTIVKKHMTKEYEREDCDDGSIDSWGDDSNSSDIKTKPKLTKLLPKSPIDDGEIPSTSADNNTSNLVTISPAPPKPPRLNASNSSSLFSLDDLDYKDKESRSDTLLTSMDTVKENLKMSDEEKTENNFEEESDTYKHESIERDSNSISYSNPSDSVSLKLINESKLDVKDETSIMTSHTSTHHPQDISACNKSIDYAGKGSFDQDLGSLESHRSNNEKKDEYFDDDILDDIKFDSSEEITFSDTDDQILDGNSYFNTLNPKNDEVKKNNNILTESTLKLNECLDEELKILDEDDPNDSLKLDNSPRSTESSKRGTLGRVDTLQGDEELWEANPSLQQLDSNGNSETENCIKSEHIIVYANQKSKKRIHKSIDDKLNPDSHKSSIVENESSSVNDLGSLVLSASPVDLDHTLDEIVENLPCDNIDKGEIHMSSNGNSSDLQSLPLSASSVKRQHSEDLEMNSSIDRDKFSLNDIKEASPAKVKRNKSLITKAKESFNSRRDSLSIADLFTVNKFRKRSTSVSLEKSYSEIKLSKDKYWRDRKRSAVKKNYSFDGYERFTPLRSLDSSGIRENVTSIEVEKIGNEPITYFGNDSVDESTPRVKNETDVSDSESEYNFQVDGIADLMIPLSQLENSLELPENIQFLLRQLRLRLIKENAKKEENDVKLVILERNKIELETQLREIENTNTELMCQNTKMSATNQLLAYQKNARTEDVVVYENFLLQLEKVCAGLRQQIADLTNKNVMKAIKLDELTVQMEIICEINDKLQQQRAKKFSTTNSECQVDIEVTDFSCQVTPRPSLTYTDVNCAGESNEIVEIEGLLYEDFTMQTSLPTLHENVEYMENKSQSTQVEPSCIYNNLNENYTQTTPRFFMSLGLQTNELSISEFATQTEEMADNSNDLHDENITSTDGDIKVYDTPPIHVYKEPCNASIQTVKDPVRDNMSQTGTEWKLTVESQTMSVLYENKICQTLFSESNPSICDNFTQVDINETENIGVQTELIDNLNDDPDIEIHNMATQTEKEQHFTDKLNADESNVLYKTNLLKNHLSSSIDSIDLRSIHNCDCLNVQSVKSFNISKDSLFKNFNLESPRGTVSKVSFYSSPPESPKRNVSPKLVNDGIQRLERMMMKLQDIQEDSLSKLVQASENRYEHNINQMNNNFNELVLDLKEEMTTFKNDIQDFMKDKHIAGEEKIPYGDLVRNLKEDNCIQVSKISEEMINAQNSCFNALKEELENGIRDIKLAGLDENSSKEDIRKALNDLNCIVSKQLNDMGNQLTIPLSDSINSKIDFEMKEIYLKVSDVVQNESKKVMELEKDLLENIKILANDFKELGTVNKQGFEVLKINTESSNKPISDELQQHFQELQQKICKQQEDIMAKFYTLSSAIQHEDSFSQRTRCLDEDVDERSSELTDLMHENEKLRRDLETEKCKINNLITPQYSVLEHNFQSIDSVGNEDSFSTPQMMSNQYPLDNSAVLSSTKERKYLKDIEKIKASNLIADGKLQEVENKNISIENRLTFTQMLLSEEEKKVTSLRKELNLASQKKLSLEEELFIHQKNVVKQQEVSRRLHILTNEKEERELKLKTLSEQMDQNNILMKNKDVQISQLERKLHLISRSNNELQSEVQSLTMTIFTADEKRKSIDALNIQLKKELELQKLTLQEKENLLTEFESKVRSYRSDINMKHIAQQQLQKDLDNLSDIVNDRNREVDTLERKITELEKQKRINNSINHELQGKLANLSEEKNQLSAEILILKERSVSTEIDKGNSDFNSKLLQKYKDDYNELHEKLSNDYIPKSSLKIYEEEIESKYQLKVNEKIADFQIATENSQSRELFLKESFAATEENLRKEMDNLSEEVLRLRARLSLRSDRSDIWRKRHDKVLKHLQDNQEKVSFEKINKNDSLSFDKSNGNSHTRGLELSDIRYRMDKSSRVSPFGRHSLQEPLVFEDEGRRQKRGPVDLIDSCYRSHSKHLERSLNQIYDESHGHFESTEKFTDQASSSYDEIDSMRRVSNKGIGNPILSSTLIQEDRDQNASCPEYITMLRKKYSV